VSGFAAFYPTCLLLLFGCEIFRSCHDYTIHYNTALTRRPWRVAVERQVNGMPDICSYTDKGIIYLSRGFYLEVQRLEAATSNGVL
jgi:hypothetical protein